MPLNSSAIDLWITHDLSPAQAGYARVTTHSHLTAESILSLDWMLHGGPSAARPTAETSLIFHVRGGARLVSDHTLADQSVSDGDVIIMWHTPLEGDEEPDDHRPTIDDILGYLQLARYPSTFVGIPSDISAGSAAELRAEMPAPEKNAVTFNFSGGSTAHFNNSVIAAVATLNDSLNTVQSSQSLDPAVKELLFRLIPAVEEMLKASKLSDDEVELAAESAQELVTEKRPAFWKRAGNALLDIAKRVGEAGAPVVDLVSKILALVPPV